MPGRKKEPRITVYCAWCKKPKEVTKPVFERQNKFYCNIQHRNLGFKKEN